MLKVMNDNGCTSSIKDKILTVTVKCGWKEGTRITFPKEGDQVRTLTLTIKFRFYSGAVLGADSALCNFVISKVVINL